MKACIFGLLVCLSLASGHQVESSKAEYLSDFSTFNDFFQNNPDKGFAPFSSSKEFLFKDSIKPPGSYNAYERPKNYYLQNHGFYPSSYFNHPHSHTSFSEYSNNLPFNTPYSSSNSYYSFLNDKQPSSYYRNQYSNSYYMGSSDKTNHPSSYYPNMHSSNYYPGSNDKLFSDYPNRYSNYYPFVDEKSMSAYGNYPNQYNGNYNLGPNDKSYSSYYTNPYSSSYYPGSDDKLSSYYPNRHGSSYYPGSDDKQASSYYPKYYSTSYYPGSDDKQVSSYFPNRHINSYYLFSDDKSKYSPYSYSNPMNLPSNDTPTNKVCKQYYDNPNRYHNDPSSYYPRSSYDPSSSSYYPSYSSNYNPYTYSNYPTSSFESYRSDPPSSDFPDARSAPNWFCNYFDPHSAYHFANYYGLPQCVSSNPNFRNKN